MKKENDIFHSVGNHKLVLILMTKLVELLDTVYKLFISNMPDRKEKIVSQILMSWLPSTNHSCRLENTEVIFSDYHDFLVFVSLTVNHTSTHDSTYPEYGR